MEESSERGSGARSMRDQCVEGWRVRRAYFGRWRWRWLIVLGVLALVVTILIPRDRALLAALQIDTEAATSWARRLSDWGQFEVSTLAVAAFFGVGGWLRRRRDWTRVATYALIAGIVGGVLVNVFRPTFGRTRPSSDLPDAFHGPSLDHDFHSFPSGHACSTACPRRVRRHRGRRWRRCVHADARGTGTTPAWPGLTPLFNKAKKRRIPDTAFHFSASPFHLEEASVNN